MMNIFKTFETYLKEPLSVLRDNFIQIVSIQTGNIFENKPSIDVSLMKNKAQLTVVNNEKIYNLLSLVTLRAGLNKEEKKGANKGVNKGVNINNKEERENESA